MNEEKSKDKKEKITLADFWMYVGTKDERIRAIADKAGHITFHLVMLVALGDFLIRSLFLKAPWLETLGTGIIFFGGAGIYSILWVLKGGTFLDSAAQKKTYGKFMLWASLGAAVLSYGVLFFLGAFNPLAQTAWWVFIVPLLAGAATLAGQTVKSESESQGLPKVE